MVFIFIPVHRHCMFLHGGLQKNIEFHTKIVKNAGFLTSFEVHILSQMYALATLAHINTASSNHCSKLRALRAREIFWKESQPERNVTVLKEGNQYYPMC